MKNCNCGEEIKELKKTIQAYQDSFGFINTWNAKFKEYNENCGPITYPIDDEKLNVSDRREKMEWYKTNDETNKFILFLKREFKKISYGSSDIADGIKNILFSDIDIKDKFSTIKMISDLLACDMRNRGSVSYLQNMKNVSYEFEVAYNLKEKIKKFENKLEYDEDKPVCQIENEE